jgi:hypothetical protein
VPSPKICIESQKSLPHNIGMTIATTQTKKSLSQSLNGPNGTVQTHDVCLSSATTQDPKLSEACAQAYDDYLKLPLDYTMVGFEEDQVLPERADVCGKAAYDTLVRGYYIGQKPFETTYAAYLQCEDVLASREMANQEVPLMLDKIARYLPDRYREQYQKKNLFIRDRILRNMAAQGWTADHISMIKPYGKTVSLIFADATSGETVHVGLSFILTDPAFRLYDEYNH